jgi:hypothetical protein
MVGSGRGWFPRGNVKFNPRNPKILLGNGHRSFREILHPNDFAFGMAIRLKPF